MAQLVFELIVELVVGLFSHKWWLFALVVVVIVAILAALPLA